MESNVKVMLRNGEAPPCMGPGVRMLLETIEDDGSVALASQTLGISYSKCWKMIRNAEEGFGTKLIERSSGGKNGGHAYLTEEGKRVLDSFRKMEKDVKEYARRSFRKHFDFLEGQSHLMPDDPSMG